MVRKQISVVEAAQSVLLRDDSPSKIIQGEIVAVLRV